MILSVLIPSTFDRNDMTEKLVNIFYAQIEKLNLSDQVEVVVDIDNYERSIGEKRNDLYKMAKGEYSVQWDSDDGISDDGIELIMQELEDEPDCVTYQERVDIDGKIMKSNHSSLYSDWEGDGEKELKDGFHFHRTPFFKNVIKTEIARSVPVPLIRYAEDIAWSRLIKPYLNREFHIGKEIYYYIHRSSNFNKRYGIK